MEFVNTFNKGMNSDINIVYQPDGSYRYAKNCQIISQDGNNYTIKDVLGNVNTFTINTPYSSYDPIGGPTYQIKPMSIGFISFPDVLVVFSTNTVPAGGETYGEIGLLYYKQYGEGVEPTDTYSPTGTGANFNVGYQVLYHHKSLNFSNLHKIEGFAFPENDLIKRVYWTDNYNEPRVFNIADPIFLNYYGPAQLTIGNQYMVLAGIVEHPIASGTFYGPGLPAGNIITATTTSFTYITTTPFAKVIAYYDYHLLTWTPDRNLGNINFNSYGIGTVNCGHKIYFYRVGRASAGIYSTWSYGSTPIHVGMLNDAAVLTGNTYHDFVGNGSSSTLVNSTRSVKIDISGINTYYDTIELAVAEYDQSNSVPYSITKVVQASITGSSMTLEHTGGISLGTLTLNDITLFPANILKIKTLTTSKNYNLIANLTERAEFTETITLTSLASYQYPLIEQGDNTTCSNLQVFDNLSPVVGVNPGVNQVLPNSKWYVTNGDLGANTVVYNGVNYITGDVITGVTGFYTIAFAGAGAARSCVNNSRYMAINSTTSSRQRNNPIIFTSTVYGFWDYKNPAVDEKVRGYWSNEKYRFGILFYDLKGNPYYVRWLSDYTMPTIATKGGLMISNISVGGSTQYSLNPSGVKVSIDIPTSLVGNVKGFSIVRAERDARIVTQGYVGRIVADSVTVPGVNIQYPEGTLFYSSFVSGTVPLPTAGAVNVYTYICPDNMVDPSNSIMPKTFGLDSTDTLEEACWLEPFAFPGGGVANSYYRSTTSDRQAVSAKFILPLASDAYSPRIINFANIGSENLKYCDEDSYVTNWQAANIDFHNIVQTGQNAVQPSDVCCGGPAGDLGNYRGGVGGKKMIFKTNGGLNHYTSVGEYCAVDRSEKILMNYCKNISAANQYGGSGDSAKANTTYISTGHYQPIDSTVLADTYALKVTYTVSAGVLVLNETVTGGTSGATGIIRVINGTTIYLGTVTGTFVNGETITGGTSGGTGVITANSFVYHFEGMEIMGGDCYTNMIDQVYALYNNAYVSPYGGPSTPPSYSIVNFWPCECNANYNLRRGRKASNSYAYPGSFGPQSIVWDDGTRTGVLEDYSYNPGYTADGKNIQYPALPLNYINASRFPVRIRFAGVKFFGEIIDSFRTFLINDYKDLNGQSGEINNIRERDGRVIVWQNHSVVTVPVLERQLLSATSGAATTIGTGGVVDRFDPLNSFHGNQHQHGLVPTEYGFLWFDMRNKAVVAMDMNGGIIEVSKIAGEEGFFNEIFVENTGTYQGTTAMLNDPLWNINSDMPLVGVGIVGVYEPKLKMTYLTFKFVQRVEGNFINKDFTICYYHTDKCFTEFLECTPAIWHNHNQIVIATKRPMNPTKYYGPGMASTAFAVGDIVRGVTNNIEYICTVAVTITTYDPTVNTDPTYVGNVYWTVVNSTDQIWVLNQPATLGQTTAPGYQYNKYFGIVVDNVFDYVVTPKKGVISVTNYEAGQVGDNITDITTYADNSQTGTVSSIKSWNRSYQYKDGSWWGEYPLASTLARITDKYLKVRMTKHNWVTVPTVEAGLRFVVQYIKSFFFPKR